MVSGSKIGAFALTEPEAGSDAANVQTQARPSADGSHYILDGEKRYITNAAFAQVLTVMARTPVPGSNETAITAFLVTPDMPGFEIVEPRMDKMGIRGTATGRLVFKSMSVPAQNILGQLGKGLKLALTVLDFGRTTFGACSTGSAKMCLRLAAEHANTRRQFGRTLGEFELIKQKLARMAAAAYAMEAMTTVTASLIDRGLEDYMLETAMLKVFTTEALWEVVNDAFQIHGGAAYFTGLPVERILRDARINQIAEGANEVLERQYVQERFARAAMELFASAAVLSRWDAEIQSPPAGPGTNGAPHSVPKLFLVTSFRRLQQALAELHDNEDPMVTAVANQVLQKG
jgi:alkylation response protein AidB-like acyl-CoA dehydrogenase